MGFGNVDSAIGGNQYIIGVRQMGRRITNLTGGTNSHQQFALRAELHYRTTDVGSIRIEIDLGLIGHAGISHPDVTFMIHIHAVRPQNLTGTKLGHYAAIGVQLHHGIDFRIKPAGVGTTAITSPDMNAIDININRAHRTPAAAIW
jgi:hypothetical protein